MHKFLILNLRFLIGEMGFCLESQKQSRIVSREAAKTTKGRSLDEGRGFSAAEIDMSVQADDFSPVTRIFHLFSRFFTLFFSHKRLVFRQLGKIPGYKRCKAQKIKCEVAENPNFIRKSQRHETAGAEIFQRGVSMRSPSLRGKSETRHLVSYELKEAESGAFRTVTAPRSHLINAARG